MAAQVLKTRGAMTEYDLEVKIMDIVEDDIENEHQLGQFCIEFQRAVGVLLREGLIEECGEAGPDGRFFVAAGFTEGGY